MNKKIKIAIASDHAGFSKKKIVVDFLKSQSYEVKDFGSFTSNSVDYPDFAHLMADAVEDKYFDIGFSLCGSGNGINMTVNKHQKIRAALCWNSEIAKLARNHNDANVCSIPARFVTDDEAIEIVKTFLYQEFDGGRHSRRIKNIPVIDIRKYYDSY